MISALILRCIMHALISEFPVVIFDNMAIYSRPIQVCVRSMLLRSIGIYSL